MSEKRNKHGDRVAMTLKELRNRFSLTQTILAEKIGVNTSTIQNWESGKTVPNMGHVFDIADSLGIKPADVYGQDEIGTGHPIRIQAAEPYSPITNLLRTKQPAASMVAIGKAMVIADDEMATHPKHRWTAPERLKLVLDVLEALRKIEERMEPHKGNENE